jgi:hypothetical protein
MAKVTVEIEADTITVSELQESYRATKQRIVELKSRESLRQWEYEDLKEAEFDLSALDRVIQYYVTYPDYVEFMKEFDDE